MVEAALLDGVRVFGHPRFASAMDELGEQLQRDDTTAVTATTSNPRAFLEAQGVDIPQDLQPSLLIFDLETTSAKDTTGQQPACLCYERCVDMNGKKRCWKLCFCARAMSAGVGSRNA